MFNSLSFKSSATILSRDPDYSWLRGVSPDSVESLHKLCDEVHQTLLGGPLFEIAKEDWNDAIKHLGIDSLNVLHAERAERASMLTILTGDGVLRHCQVLLGLARAVVHNRPKGSFIAKLFNSAAGIDENCRRVGFAFLELVDTRNQNSQSLPWDPNFPLEILRTL